MELSASLSSSSSFNSSTCREKKRQQESGLTVLERIITETLTVDGDDGVTGDKKQTLSQLSSVEHMKVM